MEDKIISIKDEFIKNSTPGIGRVTFDINLNVKRHINEINIALWLKDTFCGNIKVLQEKDKEVGIKSPDFNWNNQLWELKTCTSLCSIDTRLKKAIRQIRDCKNKGGIILNIFNNDNNLKEMQDIIIKRLAHSSINNVITIIIINEKLNEIYIKNKRKESVTSSV